MDEERGAARRPGGGGNSVAPAFFLSVPSPEATEPNAMINLSYLGAVSLATGLLVLGVGLIRNYKGDRKRHG